MRILGNIRELETSLILVIVHHLRSHFQPKVDRAAIPLPIGRVTVDIEDGLAEAFLE